MNIMGVRSLIIGGPGRAEPVAVRGYDPLADGEYILLCDKACAPGCDVAETANGPADYSDTLAIFPQVCLNGKALCFFPIMMKKPPIRESRTSH